MKKLALFFVICTAIWACGSQDNKQQDEVAEEAVVDLNLLSAEELLTVVNKRKAAAENDTTGNKYLLADLYVAYKTYGERFPNTAAAADYLFRAGEIAMNLNQSVDAIKLFEMVYNDYPDYEKHAYALFLKAFVIENQAMQYDEAKRLYTEFMEKFPDHPMADDAEYSIKNMGKSPEELIKEFEMQDSIKRAQEAA